MSVTLEKFLTRIHEIDENWDIDKLRPIARKFRESHLKAMSEMTTKTELKEYLDKIHPEYEPQRPRIVESAPYIPGTCPECGSTDHMDCTDPAYWDE
jgi:hypothetical protein